MAEKTEKLTSLTILIESSTQPELGSPVKLKTSGEVFEGEICSGANDVPIGFIENVERSNTGLATEQRWACRVPVLGAVQELDVNGSVAIGARLILHSSGTKMVSQTVVLTGANHKFSPALALDNNTSGDARILCLVQPAYIPIT